MTPRFSPDELRQRLAQPLAHPDAGQLRQAADQVSGWLLHHFASLPEQPLGKPASRAEMERLLREPPPEEGAEFAQVLADFQDKVAPHALRTNHPRFFAFVPGAPTFLSVLGDFLCAGTNFFAGVWAEAAGPTQVELVVLDWFKDFLGYPPQAQGLLTGGGSEANLLALIVARERLAFADRPRAVLYVSDHRHSSLDRAAWAIGLHPDQVRVVPTTAGRLEPSALRDQVHRDRAAGRLPWAVAANAGSTSTGAVDPLNLLADYCPTAGLWLHVDAAYGWPAVLTSEGRQLLTGIHRADSITLDPHKWFGQTFEAGCLLVRDGPRLSEAFACRADYLQDVAAAGDEVNFCDRGLALTRRFRALKIWLSVKTLGVGWYRLLVDRCCRLADLAEALLRERSDFQVLAPRQLSIVCFRYRPPSWRGGLPQEEEVLDRVNRQIVQELLAGGKAFLSSTRLEGKVALRFCFINWRTTAADVEETIQLVAALGRRLCG